MASVSEMQSKVEQQRSINNELRRELAVLANGISNASSGWNNVCGYVNGTLSEGYARVENSHEIALRAYEVQGDIERMYALFKNIELANKKIRECKNKIYYEFANYNAVRKIMEAMLNNVEVAFVSDKTITKAVEVKHLQIPDYWLTCALLSIMAWKNDDKELAKKALDRAFKLDKKYTSMFFFAFHLRINKDKVAIKWFKEYLSCARTGEDQQTLLLMLTIASKTLKEENDSELISLMNSCINNFIQDDMNRNGYSEEDIVNRIMRYIQGFKTQESIKYPVLSKYCKEMNFLIDFMLSAKNNINILEFVRKTLVVTSSEKNNYLNQYIDELIHSSNTVEKEVTDKIKYNELIIAKQGNIESAKAAYNEWKTHQESELETIGEMVEWIFKSELKSTNPIVVRSMFILIKNFIQQAIEKNTENYRSKKKHIYDIKINDYETKADLTNEADEHKKIQQYCDEKAFGLIANEKIWPAFIGFALAALAVVGTIVFANPVFLIVTLGGVLGGVLKIIITNRNKKRIMSNCAIEALSLKGILSQIIAEYSNYEKEYMEYDNYYDDIMYEFSNI